MKVSCTYCSEEHDISHMEPSYALPDCIAAMSPKERDDSDVIISKDICAIRKERGFVRVLLPMPVQGEAPCNWGVWVELFTYSDFMNIVDAWIEPELLQLQRPAKLANELQGYPGSMGLPGMVSFHNMKSIGRFELFLELERERVPALVRDQREGVTVAQKLEWLLTMIHPTGGGS